ncbi:alpha/beta hydrolase, partial [candidate division KSB1 bacterium]|nr:alpha/beta hydrolase [candidate division KSB1 bacterium]
MTFLTSNKGIKLLFTLVLILSFTLFQSCEPEEEVIAQGLDDENRALAQGQFVELTNGKVHYEMSGDENAQTVVLLHGYSVPMYIWDKTFQPLVEAGFRVLRLDFYGRGFSDRRDLRYDKDLYIAQVSELLEALNITGPVDLVGMSMGGSIAVAFTDQYPEKVRKVIFIDTEFSSGSPPLPPDYMTTGVKLMREQAESMAEGQLGDFYNPDNFPGWPDKYKVQMQYEGFFRALISTSM